MAKGHEDHRNQKKKPKFTLKEKRQMKREKKERDLNTPHDFDTPHTDVVI
jgi:hypothetical protein